MSRLNRRSFRSTHSPIKPRKLKQPRRTLGAEPLEDRRLLAVFAVTSLADSGPQTLRAAVAAANAQSGADTVVFDEQLSGDIQLESRIDVTSEIEILGPGADVMSIDGMSSTRLLLVTDQGNLTVESLTLKNGLAQRGGAIHSVGTVTIRDSVVTGNSATVLGGAVYTTGPFTVESSVFSENTSAGIGGAINSLRGNLTLNSSVLSGNTAGSDGGAIAIRGAQFVYTEFHFTNTTFDGNAAGRDGGAIRTGYNTAGYLNHVTLVDNTAGDDGGGAYVDVDSGLTSRNTIFASNSADGVGNDMAQRGAINFAYTLLSDNEDTFLAEANPDSNGNLVGGALGGILNARLGQVVPDDTLPHRPLQHFSPAINAGNPNIVDPPLFDGRGEPFNRVSLGRVDMGAVEAQQRTFRVDGFSINDFTLLEAIQAANENAGHDTIVFDSALDGLSGGLSNTEETVISDSVDILGPEYDPITVDTGGAERALYIQNGPSGPVDVLIAGLNFIDNLPGDPASAQDGAFIFNEGNLTIRSAVFSGAETTGAGGAIFHRDGMLELDNVTMANNRADGRGGAIRADSGNVLIRNSRISGNASQVSGGAIDANDSEFLEIEDSVLVGNTAYGDGGAIYQHSGDLVLTRTGVMDNEALGPGADGGAIFTDDANPSFYDSSVTGNYAQDDGGLYFSGGFAFLQHTTISGNEVFDDGAALLAVQGASVLIEHSTIAFNTADVGGTQVGAGGGLFAVSGATMTVENSIVANNISRFGPNDTTGDDQSMTVSHSLIGADLGNNIVDNGGNLIGSGAAPIDPLLGPLLQAANGTRFHGPLSGSPALDAADPNFPGNPQFDQRGEPFQRVAGAALDMGSIESQPQILVVDTLADENDGDYSAGDLSLREALSLAGGSDQDVIRFADPIVGGTILLTMGELPVTGSVHISALTSDITIDAQGASRILHIDDGDPAQASDVIVRGLTLTGGNTQWILGQSPTEDGQGGAIRSVEALTLADVTLVDNEADLSGGGLYAAGSAGITIERSTITGNRTTFSAGTTYGAGLAIRIEDIPTLVTIRDSNISNNVASLTSIGGGLHLSIPNSYGTVEIERTTIDRNTAQAGGGVVATGTAPFAHVFFDRSTVSNNIASGGFGNGGGIVNGFSNGLMQFFNSTISGNTAGQLGGGVITGSGAELQLFGSTVVNNSAGESGGGLYLGLLAEALIDNSIIAQNEFGGTTGPDISQNMSPTSGAILDAAFSFIGDAFGTELSPAIPDANGNLVGHSAAGILDPQLGPLAHNGGLTLTHGPLENSPVINNGNPVSPGLGSLDQIGNDRIVDDRLDMGSVEVQSAGPVCDFDSDLMCSITDLDALVNAIADGGNNVNFDLTGDGLVNLADRDEWLASAGALNLTSGNAYLIGDANLDGTVDGLDFIEWNANKFTSAAAWSAGDFNADGTVDGLDFIEWNSNKFQSSDASGVGGLGYVRRRIYESEMDKQSSREFLWLPDSLSNFDNGESL